MVRDNESCLSRCRKAEPDYGDETCAECPIANGIARAAEFRRLRDARGWTQVQAAAAVGVTPNTVARWERGEVPMPLPAFRLFSLLTATDAPGSTQGAGGAGVPG